MKVESEIEIANRVCNRPSNYQDKECSRSSCTRREVIPDHPDLDHTGEHLDGRGADW
jgi:hypothetical protein